MGITAERSTSSTYKIATRGIYKTQLQRVAVVGTVEGQKQPSILSLQYSYACILLHAHISAQR